MSTATTVHGAFTRVAARRGDADFLCVEAVTAAAYGIDAGARTWREVAGEVERLRAAYAQAGYGHGHRVGLLLENRPAVFTHWLALNALGISIVPIHADMRSAEWTYMIGHSEMSLAVVQPGRESDLRAAAGEANVQLETIRPEVLGRIPAARSPARLATQPIGRGSECALLYTSGTTGRPKGCRLANGYFLRAGEWYLGLGDLATVRPDVERFITPLPLSHMNALAFSSMAAILSGGAIIQLDRFHPKTWWQSVRDSRATVVHYLGVMPAMLLSLPRSDLDHQHEVRFGFGAGVDPRHHAAFEERFAFPLLEAWAMTETGAAACIMANREPRHIGTRCFGRAEAFVETRIVRQNGVDVEGDDIPGELLVRAAGAESRRDFFLGYLKDEAATEEAWADGWFHTGDVVRKSADGDFHFVDRRKNVIRRSGENISAVEVESILDTHPAVAASAVAPTPDQTRGEEVLACIVLRKAANLPPPEKIAASIVRHALAQLSYFKAPGYVAFVDALPLTSSQKVQRGELRELAKRLPGTVQCHDMRILKRRQKRIDAAATGQAALSAAGALSGQGGLGGFTGASGLSGQGALAERSALDELEGLPGQSTGPDPRALDGIVIGPPPVRRAAKPAAPVDPPPADDSGS
jgi:acyl-CoA synthetase (AMP-forming)/AMP-acid ligase II